MRAEGVGWGGGREGWGGGLGRRGPLDNDGGESGGEGLLQQQKCKDVIITCSPGRLR